MPYQPLRCPTCGSTKVIISENQRFFCVSCEGWFVWKDELDAEPSEAVPIPASFELAATPPKAQSVVPTKAASQTHSARPQVSGSSQSAEIVTDWQTPAGYVAIGVGVLAFISSWLANGRGATPFDGFLNPLFYIGVFLGWYWINEGKEIGGRSTAQQGSTSGLKRQQELVRLRQEEQEEALRKRRERERQEAERRQCEVEQTLQLQKERERREVEKRERERQEEIRRQKEREPKDAETQQREQPQNAPSDAADGKKSKKSFDPYWLLPLWGLFIFVAVTISLTTSNSPDENWRSGSNSTEPEEALGEKEGEAKPEAEPDKSLSEADREVKSRPESKDNSSKFGPSAEPLVGTVLDCDYSNGRTYVEISLGSDDGVWMNQELNVYSASGRGYYLGQIRLVEIVKDRAVGTVDSKLAVRRGDYVTTAGI